MRKNKKSEMFSHEFEEAGLGKAPFRFIGLDRVERGVSGCHYCFTAIVWRCHIKSADGRRFHVGTDCVSKTGDKGLIRRVKEAQNLKRREAREAKRQAHHESQLQQQREANGGLTDREKSDQERQEKHTAWLTETVAPRAVLEAFAEKLEGNTSNFATSVAEGLKKGEPPQGRGLAIALEIVAKQSGRRNSKAFKKALAELTSEIIPAVEAIRKADQCILSR